MSEPATKKLLMIAYLFPPAGGIGVAGSQRVLKFAKFLPAYSWQPIILTSKEQYYESYLSLDPALLKSVPPSTKIVRTIVIRWLTTLLELKKTMAITLSPRRTAPATLVSDHAPPDRTPTRGWYPRLKDALTDLWEIPDEEMGWILPGVVAGLRVIKREKIDAIYATGRPWTALVIGVALRRLTGKPLVVDFRDPWLTNPFRAHYSGLKNRLEAVLERAVITHANVVIANTPELHEEFLLRFPQQPPSKFLTLLNGFDLDGHRFDAALCPDQTGHCFTLTHTGFLYGKRDPRPFLAAVKLLLQEQRVDRQKLKVALVGSLDLPYNLSDYLAANDLNDVVTLHGQVPYNQSIEYLWQSDVLLLLQPGTTTQIPSKLFDYIGMKKPILAVSPRDGATCRLLLKERFGVVADPDDIQEIAHAIHTLYTAWDKKSLPVTIDGGAHERFHVKTVTAGLAAALAPVVSV